MYNILHITTHLGGGVGKVLSNICKYYATNTKENIYKHKILLLEEPQKKSFFNICIENGIEVIVSDRLSIISNEIKKSDIVQLEWWHHPKFAGFLNNFPNIDTRLVIWSHISGCNYPNIPFEFIKIPDKFIFSSEYSYENPQWSETEKKYARNNTTVINSSGGFDDFNKIEKRKHEGFNIGYIGTLNYSKLNPQFANYYNSIDVDVSKFIMIGDSEYVSEIRKNISKLKVYKKIEFKNYTDNVAEEMSKFNIFSYLLNKNHFGTTENVLLEAMYMGLPVISLNQCVEKYLIKNMETGILVNNLEEYKNSVKYLFENPSERKRIGENAKRYVQNEFSVGNTVNKLNCVYDEVMKNSKRKYSFNDIFGKYPYEWFLSCLGDKKRLFHMDGNLNDYIKKDIEEEMYILKEKNKSSIRQFIKYYPNDIYLNYFNEFISNFIYHI